MAWIDRPAKELGNRDYKGEVNDGKLDIIDAELDDDLDTIYQLVNGGLDDANISATGPRIAYEKLNLDGKIRDKDISNPATTPGVTGINANKLFGTLPGSIIITTIDGGVIVNETVTREKLAPGASLWHFAQHNRNDGTEGLFVGNANPAINYLVVPAINVRNVFVPIRMTIGINGTIFVTSSPAYVTMEVRIDDPDDNGPIAISVTQKFYQTFGEAQSENHSFHLHQDRLIPGLQPGAHSIKVDVRYSANSGELYYGDLVLVSPS